MHTIHSDTHRTHRYSPHTHIHNTTHKDISTDIAHLHTHTDHIVPNVFFSQGKSITQDDVKTEKQVFPPSFNVGIKYLNSYFHFCRRPKLVGINISSTIIAQADIKRIIFIICLLCRLQIVRILVQAF